MQSRAVLLLGAVFALGTGMARAQSNDPCQPAYRSGNAFVDLANSLGAEQRRLDCAAERKAQWEEYHARQAAAKEAADAEAAHEQARQAAAEAQAEASAERQAIRERKIASAAAARAEQEREASRLAEAREAKAADDRRHLQHVELIHAESAPDNYCHDQKLAKSVIEGWNDLDTMKEAGVKVIDIEHFTTVYFHPADESFKCHGVFVTNRGWKVVGTTELKKNIAGEAMFVWERDDSQDMSLYENDATTTGSSPEMAKQVRVGEPPATVTQVTSTSVSPPAH